MASIDGSSSTPAAPSDVPDRAWVRVIRSRPVQGFRTPLMIAASVIIFLTTWQLLSYYLFNPYLIPPPTQVLATAIPMMRSGEIFRDAGISLLRVLIGFSLGSAAAIVVGVVMGRLKLVNELLDPIIEILRYLSPTAMIPIAVIWFGIGEPSKYFLI